MVEMFASTIQCFSRLFQINFCWSINQLIVLAHLQLLQKSLWKLLVVFGQHVSISFYGKHEAMPNLMAIHAIKCCCGSNYVVLVNCQLKFNEQLCKFSLAVVTNVRVHLISFSTIKAHHYLVIGKLVWSIITGNVAFSPAATQRCSQNSWKQTQQNSKTQQLFESERN